MFVSDNDGHNLEQQLLSLQKELEQLRIKNSDLEERLKAYSLINSGQISLINSLIDKVPFGVMLLDERHNIIHSNVAARKIFSAAEFEMTGQPCTNYFKCYEKHNNCKLEQADNEVSLEQIECVKDNKHVMHSAFISDEGSEKIIVETFIDISEIKEAEQELISTNKTKDEFLRMISHELRTPLNVIQGYSSLLDVEIGENKTDDVAMYIDNIQKAGEVLLRLVNNLLELSDLTAGKVKANNIPIELQMMVTQLEYRLEPDLEKQGNTLSCHHDDIPAFEQDLALLMKVLFELLTNANKFTKKGKISLNISVEKKDGVEWLCFEIKDSGCGMSETTMQQIFTAFQQADSSLTRSFEGLGLGLTIVEKIVKIINGYIEVESEEGKGSTFSIFVPFTAVKPA